MKKLGEIMMEKARSNHLRLLMLGVIYLLVSAGPVSGSAGVDASGFLGTLHWRSIGPATGGRVTTVTGVASRPLVYYLGSTGGGVWKTDDGGLTWNPISDGFFRTGSVGAVAVADSDPNVVYAGTGEACLRNDISHGDGVYKSLDAGKTWKHMGLDDSRHISRIRIHPRNADLVYVAALGDVYARSQQSGVFRSRDGGKSWENVLPVDENTGASDLIMDPNNSRILYAGMWQVDIKPWGIYSGGAGSGLYKTTDGGDTWVELTNGLPRGVKGRIGVAVSPVVPDRVWTLVEADDGGLFRSEDAGRSWRKVNDDFQLRRRHYYYTHVYADTQDGDTVYVLTSPLLKSVDGGRSFRPVRVPHGDNHDLWIAPDNNQRMINGNDGGANVSLNGGRSWTRQDTQATRQLYHVTTDNQFPYRVYGSQQDGSTISVSSRSGRFRFGALPDRYPVGGGESGYIAVDPRDANIVYGGSYWGRITRYDHRSKEIRNISISPDLPAGRPSADWKYRFDWTFPIVFSPHDPATLYAGGNVLFKTTNEGQSWQAISPDLTRNDTSKLQDGRLSQIYCTIFSVAESQIQRDLIWVGTSDGLVQLTRNGGKTWEIVTPPQMPEWSRISLVEPSSHNAAAAYLAVNRFDLGDNRPYLYKTDDYGKTWKQITNGIRAGDFVRAVREDPNRQGLLYAGTETGVYFSLDDGARWQSLQMNLPAVPVHDLVVKEDDLVIATHGRSFWILDDITLLQQLTREVISSDVYLFQPRDVYRARGFTAGINYYLHDKPSEGVTLELLDAGGNLIRRLSSDAQRPAAKPGRQEFFRGGLTGKWIPSRRGMNRFQWDLRYPNGHKIRGAPTFLFGGNLRGPVALPGSYQVRITVGEKSLTRQFQIKGDPRSGTGLADLRRQFELLISIRDRVSEAHDAVSRILSTRKALEAAGDRNGTAEQNSPMSMALIQELNTILGQLVELRFRGIDDQMLVYPLQLNNKIISLQGVVASADARPTEQVEEEFKILSSQLETQLAHLKTVLEKKIPAFNRLMRREGIPAGPGKAQRLPQGNSAGVDVTNAPLSPRQTLKIRQISDLQVSPNGDRIAMSVADPVRGTRRTSNIWVFDRKSRRMMHFTTSDKSDRRPRWSADGNRLAFLSNRDGKTQIYLISWRGGEAEALTESKTDIPSFEWSPNGHTIAFLSADPKSEEEEKNLKNKNDATVVNQDTKDPRLRLIDVGSRKVKSLTPDKLRIAEFLWAPRGDRLILSATDHPRRDLLSNHLYSVDLSDNPEISAIETPEGPFRKIKISGDGGTIAYLGGRTKDGPQPHDLFIRAIEGGKPRNLTSASVDRPISAFHWRRDGSLTVLAATGFTTAFYNVTGEGRATRLAGFEVLPARSFAAGPGVLAFVGETAAKLPELWISDGSGKSQQVSHFNKDWDAVKLVKPRILQYPSFDGVTIEAALYLPFEYKQGNRIPCVVLVHGGPSSRWSQRFHAWAQLLATRGVAVLCPNIRGSTGYGHPFLISNRYDWGGDDWKDVLAGVDFVVGRGIADPERLGIGGWSYGGYMAAWAVTQTTRFKAAVSGAPMTDLASEFGTESPGVNVGDTWALGTPYENLDLFVQHSPVTFVKRVKTPILLLQGEKDRTDPLGQSRQFYRGLRRYGVEAQLVVYPRMGHGPREEEHQLDILKRMIDWFSKYLKLSASP